jgi:hypothetical protein
MRFDIENQLSSAQAFTGAATASTNAYKKQSAAQDISIGRRLSILGIVTTAAGAGSTHTMDAIQSANTNLSSPDVLASRSIVAATLTVGYAFEIQFPQGTMTKQYLGFQNTSTGGTTTVSLDVYLVPSDEIPKYKSFTKVVDADVT